MSERSDLRYSTISFLSDYGRVDEFVGVVHSVIRTFAPDVAVVDITHDVPAHDVRAGGLTLARSAQYLAPGVVLAVVDPGVGTDRRGIAVEVGDGASVLVGPDNGLLAPAVAMVGGATRVVELTSAEHRLEAPGPTFDGRDVFAPAAAALCRGVALDELGPDVDPLTLRPGLFPLPQAEDDGLGAEVLWVDRYGNVQLNVGPDDLPITFGPRIELRLAAGDPTADPTVGVVRSVRRVDAYADLGPGELGLLVDSSGLLAISMDQRSAADELALAVGDQATLLAGSDGDTQPVALGPRRS